MTTFLPFSSAEVIHSPREPTPMPLISFSPSPGHAPLHPQSFTLTVQRLFEVGGSGAGAGTAQDGALVSSGAVT